MYLASAQVDLCTEERVVDDCPCGRVVEYDALAVASDEQLVALAHVNRLDGEVADAADACEYGRAGGLLVYALVLGGKVEVALAVFLQFLYHQTIGAGKVGNELAVLSHAEQLAVFRDDPHVTTVVFHDACGVLQFGISIFYEFTGMFSLLHEVDSMPRCTDEHIAIAQPVDAGNVGDGCVALGIGEWNVGKLLSVVEQQTFVGSKQ